MKRVQQSFGSIKLSNLSTSWATVSYQEALYSLENVALKFWHYVLPDLYDSQRTNMTENDVCLGKCVRTMS
jgi:hypothetical protein